MKIIANEKNYESFLLNKADIEIGKELFDELVSKIINSGYEIKDKKDKRLFLSAEFDDGEGSGSFATITMGP